MFASLSARVAAIGLLVILAFAALVGLLADAARETSTSFGWVNHSATVIETTQDALDLLRSAESGQRGFIITHEAGYAGLVDGQLGASARAMARVVALTADNPLQHERAGDLAALMAERAILLRQPLALGRAGDFAGAVAVIAAGRGRALMGALTARAQVFLDQERLLQEARVRTAEARLRRGRARALAGAGVVTLLVLVGFSLLVRGIRRPLDTMLAAMARLGRGEQVRVDAGRGAREFTRLAAGYNAMADRLALAVADQAAGERRLQRANAELQQQGDTLRERGEVIELLGGMAHRMQAARTDDELAQIVRVFVPRVLPGVAGALYAHNNSRNLLVPVAGWGGLAPGEGFAPDQCWALRRGQGHAVAAPGQDIHCAHTDAAAYHCEPLLAGGEVIGVLHLRGAVDGETRFRLSVLTENIASALVNHRLQRSLREQTIRDPLTGLFNRRYMEETLALEIARAARTDAGLGVVMCDVDHFKRFNDEWGHDAGDAVLQAVAAELRRRFRDGDVVCRFGGEEFTVIAPGGTADTLMARVELVRQAIAEVSVRQGGRTLGAVSMSFGIAIWAPGMTRDGAALVQAADAALYEAKRAGRNRATLSLAA